MDGETTEWMAGVVTLAAYPGMAYHRTLPTDTDWRDQWHDDWSARGSALVPERVYEWHELDWVSPDVAAIRAMVRDAADKRTSGS